MAELYRSLQDLFEVEANRLMPGSGQAIAKWCDGVFVVEHHALEHTTTYDAVNVPTIDGIKRAEEGDWVVKIGPGFAVYSNSQFLQLFEEVA